jgi:hypothetical protein
MLIPYLKQLLRQEMKRIAKMQDLNSLTFKLRNFFPHRYEVNKPNLFLLVFFFFFSVNINRWGIFTKMEFEPVSHEEAGITWHFV